MLISKRLKSRGLRVILLFMTSSFLALAKSGLAKDQNVQAQLICEVKSIQPGRPFWLAVRLQMADGWHTYWRNPGDSGMPTRIEWQVPEGFEAGDIQWPFPERFEEAGLINFGYKAEVLLLTQMTPPQSITSSEVKISAKVNWLECKDICLPGSAELSLQLPSKKSTPQPNDTWAAAFKSAKEQIPVDGDDWHISAEKAGDDILLKVTASDESKTAPERIQFFPTQTGIINYAGISESNRIGNGYVISAPKSPYMSEWPKKIAGVLVADAGWVGPDNRKALEFEVTLK